MNSLDFDVKSSKVYSHSETRYGQKLVLLVQKCACPAKAYLSMDCHLVTIYHNH